MQHLLVVQNGLKVIEPQPGRQALPRWRVQCAQATPLHTFFIFRRRFAHDDLPARYLQQLRTIQTIERQQTRLLRIQQLPAPSSSSQLRPLATAWARVPGLTSTC